MTSFTGIWVPLVTPFKQGQIDFSALKALARRLVDSGVMGLIACGTTGEPAAMSEDEQLAVLDAVLDAVPGHPVAMGLCDNNIPSLLQRLERIQQRNIAGILVPPPYYIRPSQAGIIDYFNTLANASSVPIIVYNIPYRTGVAMDLETLRTIARHERICAIKDCGGSLALTMQLIADGQLEVLTGEDQQILINLSLGGAGAIAASAHIRPDLFVRLTQLVKEDRLAEARKIFYQLLPMIHRVFEEPNPGPVKAALAMMGQMSDEIRPPMQAASPEMKEALRLDLKKLECL